MRPTWFTAVVPLSTTWIGDRWGTWLAVASGTGLCPRLGFKEAENSYSLAEHTQYYKRCSIHRNRNFVYTYIAVTP